MKCVACGHKVKILDALPSLKNLMIPIEKQAPAKEAIVKKVKIKKAPKPVPEEYTVPEPTETTDSVSSFEGAEKMTTAYSQPDDTGEPKPITTSSGEEGELLDTGDPKGELLDTETEPDPIP